MKPLEEIRDVAQAVIHACGMNDPDAARQVMADSLDENQEVYETLMLVCVATGDWLRLCAVPHLGHVGRDQTLPMLVGAVVRLVDGAPVAVPVDDLPPGERAAVRFFTAAAAHDGASASAVFTTVQEAATAAGEAGTPANQEVALDFIRPLLRLLCSTLPRPRPEASS